MLEIHLKDIKLYCYHGIDEGEEVLGGDYLVNLTVTYSPTTTPVYLLEESIDYSILYSLVQQRMATPTGLLETLATEITSEIIAKFPIVNEVAISIYKLHPPIKAFEGSVGVTFKYKRD